MVRTFLRHSPLRIIALLALIAPLSAGLAHAQQSPKYYLWLQYGATHRTNPGGVGNNLKEHGGWPNHVANFEKVFAWAGPDAGVVLHLPFGFWNREVGMEIDSYDHAKASDDWLTRGFVPAWQPVCAKRTVLAYVGNASWHKRLRDLPKDDFERLVRRNLRPFLDAGFAGIILDSGANAVTRESSWRTLDGKLQRQPPNLDAETLKIIDSMGFERPTAIEPLPRRFPEYRELATREMFIEDLLFANRHQRTGNLERVTAEGYGLNRNHLKGRVCRILYPHYEWTNTPEKMVAHARQVIKSGDTVAVPWWFLYEKCKPEDFLRAASD